MVDVARAQLHVRVLDPQVGQAHVDVERTLEDRTRALKLVLARLPLRILDPRDDAVAGVADTALKLGTLAALVLGELFEVLDTLLGRLDRGFLTVVGLAQNLLGSDLEEVSDVLPTALV